MLHLLDFRCPRGMIGATETHSFPFVSGRRVLQYRNTRRALGYALIGFACGWMLARASSINHTQIVTREAKEISTNYQQLRSNGIRQGPTIHSAILELVSQRPNWRKDYNLSDCLPRWIPQAEVERWELLRSNATVQRVLDIDSVLHRDDSFWNVKRWGSRDASFTYAIASNGFGHRLGNLAFSFICNIVPNKKKQQIVYWDSPGSDNNAVWHALFEDSPLLIGAPPHWTRQSKFGPVNDYRKRIGQQEENHCDYKEWFDVRCGGNCRGFDFSRDTWLLRLASEPSAQEFFMLLRAQLQQHVKDKIADFIENHFAKDKIVIGVHIRSGNGKDDGHGDFEKKNRGDWLSDLPSAIGTVRKHVRMVALSVIDRHNYGLPEIDDLFQIFLATDSVQVLEEFRRQDARVLFVQQERMGDGAGVPINTPLKCENRSESECSIHAEEAMFMDAMIMSSCDVALAESFSNWMYTLPATLRMAENKVFCESGRAQLGVKGEKGSILGPASWWAHPPPNTLPIRCYQGTWAARDRFDPTK